jgi:hypothetical protein
MYQRFAAAGEAGRAERPVTTGTNGPTTALLLGAQAVGGVQHCLEKR